MYSPQNNPAPGKMDWKSNVAKCADCGSTEFVVGFTDNMSVGQFSFDKVECKRCGCRVVVKTNESST